MGLVQLSKMLGLLLSGSRHFQLSGNTQALSFQEMCDTTYWKEKGNNKDIICYNCPPTTMAYYIYFNPPCVIFIY